jgi:glycosyltransferase involved in cell wall biosynthesis
MRASSLARYFPGQGIRLDVLTAKNASAVGSDLSLLKDIPPEVTVHRTLTLDVPFKLKKFIKKLVASPKPPAAQSATNPSDAKPSDAKPNFLKKFIQNYLQPDPQVTWLPILSRAARRIIKQRKIDLVLITVPPFSTLLLVEKLRREFPRLAIVVDFRDEWLTTTFDLVSFLFHSSENTRKLAQNIEANAVTNATAIITVTDAARKEIQKRYPQLPASKFHLVPNGFDATRLVRFSATSAPRPDKKILVTYVGTVYASTEPTTVVKALESLPAELKSRFLIRFIGHIEEARFRNDLLRLGDMVELKGYLPQREALASMNETDYVLLINHDPLNVGGKFYDYVGGGKPVLGSVRVGGATHQLMDELHAGWWASSDDVDGTRQLFIDAAQRGASLGAVYHPDETLIAQYERKVLAQRYAALLHSIAGQTDQDSLANSSLGPES